MIEFTLSAPEGSLVTSPIGRVPGGYRVQVDWAGPGQAPIEFHGYSQPDEKGATAEKFEGRVIAGSDWVLFRDDGVATFSAKLTFKATAPGEHVFDAVLSGRVDIRALGFKAAIKRREDWNRLGGDLDVTLPIQFETSGELPDGASKKLKSATAYWKTFAELARHQFVANGRMGVNAGEIRTAKLVISRAADLTVAPQRVEKNYSKNA